jgi:hypothetical protein
MRGLIKNPQRGSELRCILRRSSTTRQLDKCCANRERTVDESRVVDQAPQLLLYLNTQLHQRHQRELASEFRLGGKLGLERLREGRTEAVLCDPP